MTLLTTSGTRMAAGGDTGEHGKEGDVPAQHEADDATQRKDMGEHQPDESKGSHQRSDNRVDVFGGHVPKWARHVLLGRRGGLDAFAAPPPPPRWGRRLMRAASVVIGHD